jgi:hypothetical protein
VMLAGLGHQPIAKLPELDRNCIPRSDASGRGNDPGGGDRRREYCYHFHSNTQSQRGDEACSGVFVNL